ncbi:MAG: DUF1735 and LamG domain-containing protein [Bacteroidales bacterium]|nr:DUF1735 and LamG domain-containing protein [Bacteroidales bacterium]
MKKTIILTAVVALGALFTSCKDAEYTPLEGQAFIAQTQTRGNAYQTITVGKSVVSADLNVRLSNVAKKSCSFTVAPDAAALEKFNKTNSTTYVMLPADGYTITDASDVVTNKLVIEQGQSMSPSLRVNISPLSEELLETGQKYAVALTIKNDDNNSTLLPTAKTMVYVIDRVVIQPVPVIFNNATTGTQIRGQFGERGISFREWTWEANVNMDRLGVGIGQMNNQALLSVNSTNEIYIRFGDAPIDGRVLQIKTQGTQMNSNMMFTANTWYHLAFACTGNKLYLYVNGELDNSMDLPDTGYTLAGTGDAQDFTIADSGTYFKANMMIAEWRFWTVARSQAEIKNNMYSCDPKTAGLLGYFKFNEGEGKDYRDATGKGGNAASLNVPTWVPDVRIDGKSE